MNVVGITMALIVVNWQVAFSQDLKMEMATKAQHHKRYVPVRGFLRLPREEAGMTRRQIGAILKEPQAWAHNCESGNRRVDMDVAEFCDWCRACDIPPANAIRGLDRNFEYCQMK
jgi:hypothetical protein